ncbi:hypothetical protein [Planktothrix sp.]|uniref:hypothetical protein n=1 Tax=Planktothrix sp. TaxID=3088171 RepID=UPI0038D47475
MQTHQEMVEVAIRILENVKRNHVSEAKKQIEKLTPIQIIQLFSIGKHYPNELEKLKELAIHWEESKNIKKAVDGGFPEHEYPSIDYEGEYEELMG